MYHMHLKLKHILTSRLLRQGDGVHLHGSAHPGSRLWFTVYIWRHVWPTWGRLSYSPSAVICLNDCIVQCMHNVCHPGFVVCKFMSCLDKLLRQMHLSCSITVLTWVYHSRCVPSLVFMFPPGSSCLQVLARLGTSSSFPPNPTLTLLLHHSVLLDFHMSCLCYAWCHQYVYCQVQMGSGGNIAHAGHLGGAAVGAAAFLLLRRGRLRW